MRMRLVSVLVAGLVGMPALTIAQTPDERASARAIMAKRSDAVVTVEGSLKVRMSMGGRETNNADESVHAMATVLDGTGLAVMSLSAIEPGGLLTRMMSSFGGGAGPKVDMTTEPAGLRMRMADGGEFPAKIVLRDEDLNLAFLKPVDAPNASWAFVDGVSAKPAQLDLLVMVARLGESSGWKTAVSFGYVEAVIDKPRTVYLMAGAAMGRGLGTPVFDLAGRFVGLMVMKNTPVKTGGGGMASALMAGMGGGDALGMQPVILPADDIREVAKQAAGK
jgi:S1-C subfamily serine protease